MEIIWLKITRENDIKQQKKLNFKNEKIGYIIEGESYKIIQNHKNKFLTTLDYPFNCRVQGESQ